MSTQRIASQSTHARGPDGNSRAGVFDGGTAHQGRNCSLARWRARTARATVWAIALLGMSGIVGGVCWALHTPQTPSAASSGEISTLLETGATLETEIARTVHPAVQRTEILARDPEFIQLLRGNDTVGQTAFLNRAVTTATEVDALALFDATGKITAINTRYADGRPIPTERVNRVLSADFGKREIVQKCLRNGVSTSVLEFQTHCDITPAFFDSTGLSVAYSVPVFDPKGRAKIGVLSARLRFERLSGLVLGRVVGGGSVKPYLVTDAGAYFSETINANTEQPPIPVVELRDIVRPLTGGKTAQVLSRRADTYVLVFPLKSFRTLEGGGINVLVVADAGWILEDTRRDQLLAAVSAGLVGTLLLVVAGLLHAYLAARRMRATTEAASVANARLAAIVHSSSDAIIGETLDGVIVSWNPAAEKIFGFAASEVEGRPSELLEPPDRCHEMVNLRTDALENKPVDHVETQRVRKDGHLIAVSISLAVIKDRQGATIGIAKIARDITRQKRSEHELRKAFDEMERRVAERTRELSETVIALESQNAQRQEGEERFRQFAENTKDVFWMSSVKGDQILYVNPRYEEVWGRTCQELYSDPHAWMNAIEPEDQPAVMKSWLALPTRGEYEAEYRIRRPDGTIRWIRDRALPIRDKGGQIYRIAGIAEDFTDRRAAEQQVIDAKEAAETANRAKSEFLAKMSHEIRTPLNGVIGITDLLLNSALDAQQQRFARLIETSGQTLADLINDVLDFSKIEARKLELESIDFDLHSILEDVTEVMAHRAAEKGLELASYVGPGVPKFVQGDPARVKQILVNLVNNAIKFTAAGSVSTRLTLDSQSPEQVAVRFAVTDTGIGIAPQGLERLFKSFSQVEASTTRTHGGTGLGLAIAKQLAELMNGTIGVESAPGKGSTFWFTVKLGSVPAARQPHSVAGGELRGLRVLAIDGNATMRQTLRDQIQNWGVEVSATGDAEEGLKMLTAAALEGRPYRIAILENETKPIDGLALGRMIKARPEISETRLLIVLPLDSRVEPTTLEANGFCGHLLKPVRQSHLHDAIVNALAPSPHSGTTTVAENASSATAPIPAPQARILLAEDNAVNQVVASEILTRHGYAYDVVDNGRKAVEAAATRNYDLILMDCSMPEMDGFEATAEIRRNEAADPSSPVRRIPIVALTANAIKGDRELCIAAGMDAYVSKPVDVRRLIETIEMLVPPGARPEGSAVKFPDEKVEAHPTGPEPTAPFSIDELLDRCMGNVSTAQTILDEFEKEIAKDLPDLTLTVAGGDGAGAAKIAHALKGAAGVLSATAVHRYASELERLCRAGNLDNIATVMSKLRDEVWKCVDFIPAARAIISTRPQTAEAQGT